MEISERAKRLVAALEHWRTLESAYEIAQGFLDEERAEAADAFGDLEVNNG